MVSREHKRGSSLREKFHLLRSITNSHAESETSIIVDASKYIKKLKQKVEKINNETTSEQSFRESSDPNPMVTVETLEKGFMVKVTSVKNEAGMLVCVLETFEDLGLDVVEARVSCTDTFSLHAIGSSNNDDGDIMDAEAVKQAVTESIRTWSDSQA
ncbi:Helix-loop-helix DNA-binding domain superfamily [Arabidopsis suecica]|uniref:Helix-loop-helix DNA-binding domain superfamily n=1 Tax=Arabidopsis suecica TaxID=45249 RepID=A0A8T2A0Z9_ARASU|nr:Helix-loop-helix DNA-binding domain superfamily [Arabidopsis suecica]